MSAAKALADPEKVLSLFDAARVAEKLKGNSAVTFFQDDSKEPKVMTIQSSKNVVFGLPN